MTWTLKKVKKIIKIKIKNKKIRKKKSLKYKRQLV